MSSDSSSKKPNKRTAAVMDEDDPNIGLSILSSQSQNYPRAQSAVPDTFAQVASTGYGLHDTTSTSNVSNPPTQNLSSKTPWTVYPLRLPSFSAGTSVAGSNMPAGLSATSSPNAAALLSTSQSPEFPGQETEQASFSNNQPDYATSSSGMAKNRIRVAKACDRCKRKKTKCDGMNPCHACVKHELNCVYTPSVYAKSSSDAKEDEDNPDLPIISAKTLTAAVDAANNAKTMADKKKAILEIKKPVIMAKMRDRITVLENDLARLTNLVRTGNSRNGYSVNGAQTDVFPRLPPEGSDISKELSPVNTPQPTLLGGAPKLHSNGFKPVKRKNIEETAGMTGGMSASDIWAFMDAHPERYRTLKLKTRYSRRHGTALPFTFGYELMKNMPEDLKSQVRVPRMQYYGWNMSGVHYLKPRPIPPSPSLIQEIAARPLLAYFFENINPLHSILHQPMFLEQYDAYLSNPDKQECRLFSAIFHVVCAIAIRFREICENAKYDNGLEEKLFDDGYTTLQAFAFEWESVEIVQGFLLMTFYLRMCHRQPSAWAILGTAIRLSAGMGLMHKPLIEQFMSDYEILKRRRIFWACFVMDRTFCVECGRHFSIREDEISVPIPHSYVDDGWQTPISNALLQFCLALSDLVYDRNLDLNTEDLKTVKTRLVAWNDSMKDSDLNSDTELDKFKLPAALVGHFRLCYYNSLFFIHMRAIFGLIGIQWDSTFVDRQLYVECVQGVTNIATSLAKLDQLKTPWWLTLSTIYHAGCVALLLIYNQMAVDKMSEEFFKIIDLITTISKDGRFIMAKECLWSLKTLNHMVHIKLGMTLNLLKGIGLDHGSATINKGNFSSMGFLDNQGNEVLPIEIDKKNDVGVSKVQRPSQPSTNNDMSPPDHVPTSSDLFSVLPDPIFAPSISSFTDIPADQQGTEPAMSLEWFNNWDWEIGSAMAEYFSTPGGIEGGNEESNSTNNNSGMSYMNGNIPPNNDPGDQSNSFTLR